MVFTFLNDLEYVDRGDLFVEDSERTRGNEHISRQMRCKKNAKNFGLPKRVIDTEIT